MSAAPAQIVGIVLVRNEDLFVGQAVRNAAALCDRIILCDHHSADRTPQILADLASAIPGAEFHRLEHPKESQELLKPFVGTAAWIFGVDGDEIYDVEGLRRFRQRLLGGEFDQAWQVKSNVVHCEELDLERRMARGFASPPCRSMVKLYNFAAIDAWEGETVERLHGGEIRFRPGFSRESIRSLHHEQEWKTADLRCLHLCFLQRSSRDTGDSRTRESFVEFKSGGLPALFRRLVGLLQGRKAASRWKQEHYRKGDLVIVPTDAFFPG